MSLPTAPPSASPSQPRAPVRPPNPPGTTLRRVILFLLVFVTYVSPPRVNLGAIGGPREAKGVDLRAEDVILAGVLAIWVARPTFVRWRSPLKPLILLYLFWSIGATVFGIAQGWVDPLKAIFYTAKEIEFFLFFAVGMLCVRSVDDVKAAVAALVAGAIIQGGYAVFQVATGQYAGAYGVGLLGERNPHITGICACISLFLGVALFNPANVRLSAISITCTVLGTVAVVGCMSRSAIGAAVVGALAILLLEMPQRKGLLPRWAPIALFVVTAVAASVAFLLLTLGPREAKLFRHRISPMMGAESGLKTTMEQYETERKDLVFSAYWKLVMQSPAIGNGKSITFQAEESLGETHNYYLRLVIETGFVGLLLYLAIIAVVLRTCFRLYRHGHPRLVRCMGLFCLALTLGSLVAAVPQDIFVSPRIAQLYWAAVGATLALDRMKCFQREPRPMVRFA